MKHSSVIVTGGLGFIGKNFCAHKHHEFKRKIIFDKLTYASDLDFYMNVLKKLGWELIVGDINEIHTFKELTTISRPLIVNLAAESHVDNSFGNARQFMLTNALGTLAVVEFCISRAGALLHVSTDEVYGEVIDSAADELYPLSPTNPYSASKAAADILVQTYKRTYDLNTKIIRANNIFGSRQLSEKVIPKAIKAATNNVKFELHGHKPLKRHFLHTSDLANSIMTVCHSWDSSDDFIFNVAGDELVEISTLVKRIYEMCNSDPNLIEVGKDRPFNDLEYRIADDRLRNLGWKPKVDFWSELVNLCAQESYFDFVSKS